MKRAPERLRQSADPRYLAFFDRFNRQEYFEAHEVLEGLWLATEGEKRDFYKGLIQTAAVFLKLKQGKVAPAGRLAERASSHLRKYGPVFEGLDVHGVVCLLRDVQHGANPPAEGQPPRLAPQTR